MNLDELEARTPNAPARVKSPRGEVVTEPTQLRTWKEAKALPPRGLKTVIAFPLPLDASWSAVRAAIASKTQQLGGDVAEDNGALYARRKLVEADFNKIGPAWKRREGAVASVKRADELWVSRTLTLARGELAYYERPNDWMVATSARGRVTVDTDTVIKGGSDDGYFRGPAGAPTAHVLSVNDEWTFAFADARSLRAWSTALEAAKTIKYGPPPPVFELRAAACTSSGSESRTRHIVVACDGDCREPIRSAVKALRDEDASLEALWRKGPQPLDVFVLLDLAAAARRRAVLKHADAFQRARDGLKAANLRIEKARELVRPGYTAARLDVPRVAIPDIAPAPTDWRDGGLDADARSDALEAAAAFIPAGEPDRLLSLRRAASAIASMLEARSITKAAEDGRRQLRDLETVVGPVVQRGLRDMCDSLANAVKAGAWIGPEAPSSDLWRIDDVAALTKDVVLVRFACTRDAMTPGTVWVTRDATYFAPTFQKAASFFSFSSKKEEALTRLSHSDLAKASRVASPVPLKTNAVSLKARDGTSLILTLSSPGASVSAFVDVVTTCASPRPPRKVPVVVAPIVKPVVREAAVDAAARRLREALAPTVSAPAPPASPVAEPAPPEPDVPARAPIEPPLPTPAPLEPPVPAPPPTEPAATNDDRDDDVFLDARDGS